MPRGLQLVEAEARHDAAKEGPRLAHRGAVGVEPAEERLADVFGPQGAVGIETREPALPRTLGQQGAKRTTEAG